MLRRSARQGRVLDRMVVEAICLAGLVGFVGVVYLAVVLGIGRVPTSDQRTLLGFSVLAAAVTALLWVPLRTRLSRLAQRLVQDERGSRAEMLRTFGSRLTRAIPLDELLLQLAESLRSTLALDSAEVWTGAGGLFERVASDPDAGRANLVLTPSEESTLARTGVVGPAWLRVWLPQLANNREAAEVRAAAIAHSGELLGMILVERSGEVAPFDDEDEGLLAALAEQIALALHNVRLGSALQASFDELRRQADELRASRARVVAAADAERCRIERDLHDGAQQHLTALIFKLRLARELAGTDPAAARGVLAELSSDVHDALEEFRDLAHGIYPPLLVDRGLAKGLHAAVLRAHVPARVEAGAIGRYPPEVEATVYFCCLEAVQNVAKHAGSGASATVKVWEEEEGLRFEVVDDGYGFDAEAVPRGAGLANMSDRVGALGGRLTITAAPGRGTRVAGAMPLTGWPARAQPPSAGPRPT
jgi:signal transduction histidine kinase